MTTISLSGNFIFLFITKPDKVSDDQNIAEDSKIELTKVVHADDADEKPKVIEFSAEVGKKEEPKKQEGIRDVCLLFKNPMMLKTVPSLITRGWLMAAQASVYINFWIS
jgi:hypothetical protein